MKKPVAVALVVVTFIGGAVVTFNACTSNSIRTQARSKNGDDASMAALDVPATVPSAEELFLKGKYAAKVAKADADVSDGNSSLELDLRTQRPVYDLSQTLFGRKYGKPGYTLVGNFYHQGTFTIARIPDQGVKGVFFVLALAPPKLQKNFFAGQTMLRIQMDPAHPVEIVADMPDEDLLKKLKASTAAQALALLPNENPDGDARVENFSISPEPVLKKIDMGGEPYTIAEGLRGQTTQALSFQSVEESYVSFYKTGEPVNEYKLDAGAGEAGQLVMAAIHQSQADGLSKRLTFAYNCSTAPLTLLRSAMRVHDDRFAYLQKMMEQKNPTPEPKKLTANGLQGEIPMQLDRSLVVESNVAFSRVFGGRDSDLCKTTVKVYRGYRCDNIRAAVKALENWGRLPASVSTEHTTHDDVNDLKAAADELAAAKAEPAHRPKSDPRGAAAGYESDDVLH